MKKLVAIGLWLALLPPAIIGVLVAPFAALLDEWDYAKDLARAMDKLGAASLGWGGDFTISAECGSRRARCRFCRVVCRVLDWVQPGHCGGAAKREGL